MEVTACPLGAPMVGGQTSQWKRVRPAHVMTVGNRGPLHFVVDLVCLVENGGE